LLTIRMSRILPVIHLILATALLKWGEYHPHPPWWRPGMYELWRPTSDLVCYGINAPAFRLVPALYALAFGKFIPAIAGFYPQDLFLLAGVAVVWHLVGKEIDAWRHPDEFPGAKSGAGKMMRNGIVALYGIILLVTMDLYDKDSNVLGNLIERILWFVWALALILLPTQRLLAMLRRKPLNQSP
jgi:hypothetical protein